MCGWVQGGERGWEGDGRSIDSFRFVSCLKSESLGAWGFQNGMEWKGKEMMGIKGLFFLVFGFEFLVFFGMSDPRYLSIYLSIYDKACTCVALMTPFFMSIHICCQFAVIGVILLL